jgi:chorismate mutase/prephenate dehydratase
VPFETSTEGPVQPTISELASSDLRISEQLEYEADLHVMNKSGDFAQVQKLYATPHDHALCHKTLAEVAPKATILDVRSPLLACQLAADDPAAAAVAPETFGESVGLEVARRNVIDKGANKVRYAIVGLRPTSRTGNDLTAFVFSVQDSPGSLLDTLKQLGERGINMTKIQSRPMQNEEWSYLFFIEVLGHFTDRPLVTSFEEIKRVTRFFKVLGSYPALA